MSTNRIKSHLRVFEVYEKIDGHILKYVTLDPELYLPHCFIEPRIKSKIQDNKDVKSHRTP